jgi:hypothetical protein
MLGPLRGAAFGEPPPERKRPAKRAYPEGVIQRELVRWLRTMPDWMIVRVENAARRKPAQAARDKALGMLPGAPDLWLCYKRSPVWLELKDLGKCPTQEQEQVHAELRARGQVVLVGVGIEHAKEQLNRFAGMVNANVL